MNAIVRVVGWGLLTVAALFIVMVVAALAAAGGLIPKEAALGLSLLAFLAPPILIIHSIAIRRMRRLDEAAQEAHKWAWFWGGSSGMGVGLIVLAIEPYFGWGLGPDAYGDAPISPYYLGGLISAAFGCAGYLLAWAVWWLKRR